MIESVAEDPNDEYESNQIIDRNIQSQHKVLPETLNQSSFTESVDPEIQVAVNKQEFTNLIDDSLYRSKSAQ